MDELLLLRDRVNAVLVSSVDRERRGLEARLKRLHRFKAASGEPVKTNQLTKPLTKSVKTKRRRKVLQKYRNSGNAAQTWTGRGLQPRWIREAIQGQGKTLDDFRISA